MGDDDDDDDVGNVGPKSRATPRLSKKPSSSGKEREAQRASCAAPRLVLKLNFDSGRP